MDSQAQPAARVLPPTWVAVLWWVLMAVLAVALFYPVIILIAFGCDSGWQGCETASGVSLALYGLIAAVSLVALLIWAIKATSTGKRVIACLLMPVGVIVALVASSGYYFWMADRAGGLN